MNLDARPSAMAGVSLVVNVGFPYWNWGKFSWVLGWLSRSNAALGG